MFHEQALPALHFLEKRRTSYSADSGDEFSVSSVQLYQKACEKKTKDTRVLFIPPAAMLPLPTILREVSGKKRVRRMKQVPERIARNQNIYRHPRCCTMTPPSTGPRRGARLGLEIDVKFIYFSSMV
jgi:hypothetical protein